MSDDSVDPNHPLAGLTDEELQALGREVGVHVGFPGKKDPPERSPLSPEQLAALEGDFQFGRPEGEPWAVADPEDSAASPDSDEVPPLPQGHPLPVEVAAWMRRRRDFFDGDLPPDIAAIWGYPPCLVKDEGTCRMLIHAWGVEGFRGSALHQAAVRERARVETMREVETRFKAEREKGRRKRQ